MKAMDHYQQKKIALYAIIVIIAIVGYAFSPLILIFFGVLYAIRFALTTLTFDIKDKNVVITGCDTGFGNLLAKKLDQAGVRVFASCLTPSGLASLKESLSSRSVVLSLDITDEKSVDQFSEKVIRSCGNSGLWALVNNAGILDGTVVDLTPLSTYRKVMDVNFFGHVAVTRKFLRCIKKSKGRIINMTSIAGRFSGPAFSSYSASKYAMESFSDSLRVEMRQWGVQVIIMEPGSMITPLFTGASSSANKFFQMADKETQDEYGDEWVATTTKLLGGADIIAGEPDIVVNGYIQAISSRYPWHRYQLGLDATVLYLASHLPSYLVDLFFGLPLPVPRVLSKRK